MNIYCHLYTYFFLLIVLTNSRVFLEKTSEKLPNKKTNTTDTNNKY